MLLNVYSFNNNYFIDFIIFIIVIIIAILNYKLIENPFRKKIKFNLTLKGFAIAYSLLLIFSFTIFYSNGFENRTKFKLPDNLNNSFFYSEKGKKCFDIDQAHTKEDFCLMGDKEKKAKYFILGDSHVIPFFNHFDNYFYKKKISGYFSGYSGCPPILGIYAMRTDQNIRNCYKLNLKIKDFIKSKNIKNLILISRWTYYTDGGYQGNLFSHISTNPALSPSKFNSRNAFEHGLKKTLDEYSNLGVKVIILNQVPQQKINPKFYYYLINSKTVKKINQINDLSLKRIDHERYQSYTKNLFNINLKKYNNFYFLDLTNKFCKASCIFGTLNNSYYLDDNHLSEGGVKFIEKTITNFFDQKF